MTLSTVRPDPSGREAAPTEGFDAVYARVIAVLTGIVGEDYLESLDVNPETRFEADLELESMEIVQLADELIEFYGSRVDFIGWFAEMDLDALVDLSIATVVDFIVTCLDDRSVVAPS